MRVHPAPKNPNIMLPYDLVSALSEPNSLHAVPHQKKLRRLPHIFAKVLELPFDSDTDVFVQETSDSFRFVVGASAHLGAALTPHLVEIYHGVTKLVITDNRTVHDVSAIGFGGLMELDMWRFRLPDSTRPDLATADYCNGDLVVIVPKDSDGNNSLGEQQAWADGGNGGGAGRLVLALKWKK